MKHETKQTLLLWTLIGLIFFTGYVFYANSQKTEDVGVADNALRALQDHTKLTQKTLKNRIKKLEKQLASRPATCLKCQESEPVPHSCPPDPMSGDCAVSWVRLLSGKRVGSVDVACGDGWTIRWKRVKQREGL